MIVIKIETDGKSPKLGHIKQKTELYITCTRDMYQVTVANLLAQYFQGIGVIAHNSYDIATELSIRTSAFTKVGERYSDALQVLYNNSNLVARIYVKKE